MTHKTIYKIFLIITCIILTVLEFFIIYKIPQEYTLNDSWTPDTWFIMISYIINTAAVIGVTIYTIKIFLKDMYDPNDNLRF